MLSSICAPVPNYSDSFCCVLPEDICPSMIAPQESRAPSFCSSRKYRRFIVPASE